MKKRITTVAFLFLQIIHCHAEGQDGISEIFNIGQLILYWTCIFVYTMIGGIIIKLILKKLNLLKNRQTFLSFLISFAVTMWFIAIFGNDFIFYIWNHL